MERTNITFQIKNYGSSGGSKDVLMNGKYENHVKLCRRCYHIDKKVVSLSSNSLIRTRK